MVPASDDGHVGSVVVHEGDQSFVLNKAYAAAGAGAGSHDMHGLAKTTNAVNDARRREVGRTLSRRPAQDGRIHRPTSPR